MNHYSLAITGCFDTATINLFCNQEHVSSVQITNHQSSKLLVSTIQNLLAKSSLSLKDLNLLLVDIGPGAFTSLRIIVVTVNALAYALNIQIFPINSLEALSNQAIKNASPHSMVVTMINAYSQQVYATVFDKSKEKYILENTCINIDKILLDLATRHLATDILFQGNAAIMHQGKIIELFKNIPHKINTTSTFELNSEFIQNKIKNINPKTDLKPQVEPLYIKAGFYS